MRSKCVWICVGRFSNVVQEVARLMLVLIVVSGQKSLSFEVYSVRGV